MASFGGRQPGAGRKRGRPNKTLYEQFGPQCETIIREGLESKNKRDRKTMLALILPYVYPRLMTQQLSVAQMQPVKLSIEYVDPKPATD